MTKTLLTALIVFMAIISYGQSSQTRFFRDQFLRKEVSERRARFSETITKNIDGTITTEIKDLRQNEVILRNEEPFGTWTVTKKKVKLNYDFEMVYNEEMCLESIPEIKPVDYFKNNEQLGYIAPVIATGEPTINQYLRNNLYYPNKAREGGIMGTVNLIFTVSKHAEIEQLAIYESTHILLDKEAMRVLRELKLSEPPRLNGEPIEVCVIVPIRFVLN